MTRRIKITIVGTIEDALTIVQPLVDEDVRHQARLIAERRRLERNDQ